MQIAEAYRHVATASHADVGRFYEPGQRLAVGKGCIYRNARFSTYDDAAGRFLTAEGPAYVLTHECDVDQENDRLFNSDVLVCPIIPLEALVEEQHDALPGMQMVSFLSNLGARRISRLVYLPPTTGLHTYGSVMYLNHITNAPVALLQAPEADKVCSLTSFGLRDVEYAIENHLLRPKAERLALGPAT